MKTLAIACGALIASASAFAQKDMGNSQVNVDFSKYHSFTWAKSDMTEVGPAGYDVYYYEVPAYKDQMADNNPSDKTAMKGNKSSKKNKGAKSNAANSANGVNSNEPYMYSYTVIIPAEDETANGVIQEAISNELEGRGYAENAGSGDLIVSYQVFDRKATLHGYNNDDPAVADGQQVRQPSDQETFILEPGTLMITLIDAKTSQVIWDGFSKDLVNNNAFVTDEVKLKEAVHDVFQQFKYSATDKARR